MKLSSILFSIVLLTVCCGCNLEEKNESALMIFTKDYDFHEGEHEWSAGFADYPAAPEDSSLFELRHAYTEPVDSKLTKRSVMLSGRNVNRDLFMYLKKKIDNLQPNTEYTITFSVELASDLNGLLSASGGAVYLKAGASHMEPKSLIEAGSYILNIDKGNAGSGGEDMISLGDIFTESGNTGYALINRNNTMANSRYVARTNSNGELWLIIGTDASCEGTTRVFYTRIKVVFSAS
jgi:hypothetical protein